MIEKLKDIIVNYVEVEPDAIGPDSRFMEDLGFTSFDFMSMLGEIEDEFQLSAEYWDSQNGQYDEKSDFTFRDKKISMEEYEALKTEIIGSRGSF